MDMQSVSIIGIGRIGGALALALSRAGYNVENLIYRTPGNAEEIAHLISPPPRLIPFHELDALTTDFIFITSADPEIELISQQLASFASSDTCVFHTSGSQSSDVLSGLADRGCITGSIHPLISVSDPFMGGERLAGSYFCVEGSKAAVAIANDLVKKLKGIPFAIETRLKPLYHASAVTASGHLVALIDVAIEMLSKCGLNSAEAKQVLIPLIRSTVENVENQSTDQALTGTFARADTGAFERHIAALKENVSSQARQIYLELGERSLLLAEMQSAPGEDVEKIRNGISIAKSITK
ncbi:MAG: Rossmann-like and DUF2520 domain-containing protein [Pyrinomonadaceae bacterium]